MNTYIKLPNTIQSFHNTASRIETASSLGPVYVLEGEVQNSNVEYCFNCKCKMHIHSKQARSLRHLLFSNSADRLGRIALLFHNLPLSNVLFLAVKIHTDFKKLSFITGKRCYVSFFFNLLQGFVGGFIKFEVKNIDIIVSLNYTISLKKRKMLFNFYTFS